MSQFKPDAAQTLVDALESLVDGLKILVGALQTLVGAPFEAPVALQSENHLLAKALKEMVNGNPPSWRNVPASGKVLLDF